MKKKVLVTLIIVLILALSALGAWFLFFKGKVAEAEDTSKPLAAPVPVKVTQSWQGDLPL